MDRTAKALTLLAKPIGEQKETAAYSKPLLTVDFEI